MSTVTIQQANVLTPKGFMRRFSETYRPGQNTQAEAYEQVERLHEQVHEDQERKYDSFESFIRLYKKEKKSPAN